MLRNYLPENEHIACQAKIIWLNRQFLDNSDVCGYFSSSLSRAVARFIRSSLLPCCFT